MFPSSAIWRPCAALHHTMGKDPGIIEPLVPVDLVVDHSVQIDCYGEPDALRKNMEMEFTRNRERYQFLKWGMNAFETFRVVPPGIGIVHQVNLEYLARGVHHKGGVYYPDTLVGTDSHTTMINGIGVVGWGVGGIEAEAGMLGQPVYFLTPDVVGVNLKGRLKEGVTATDLVLSITEMLRREKVVGKFVEFFGEGDFFPWRCLTGPLLPIWRRNTARPWASFRWTMSPWIFSEAAAAPMMRSRRSGHTSRPRECMAYQGLERSTTRRVLEVDLSGIKPSVAGPRRPQDRIDLSDLGDTFADLFTKPAAENGFGSKTEDLPKRFTTRDGIDIGSGDVVIAAITSCTNTSNPAVLLAAGLLAKKAVEKGLTVKKHVKTSLAPGSRVVTEYLKKAGLLPYLEKLGFYLAAYGCTTCIGNAGPLDEGIEETIVRNDLVCAAVLSGNRNFEARIHPHLRANFLMSPPLVVAFALAGTVLRNMEEDPLGTGKDGRPVYLRDVWPASAEVAAVMKYATDPDTFRRLYSDLTKDHPLWNAVPSLRARCTTGRDPRTSRSLLFSRISVCSRAQYVRSPAPGLWGFLEIPLPPTISVLQARSRRPLLQERICWRTAWQRPTSRATVPAEATMRS